MTQKTPTALRVVMGNPAKRALPRNEAQPAAVRNLTPPAILTADGKRVWRKTAPMLERCGLLTQADLSMLTAHCDAMGDWLYARREMKKQKSMVVVTPNGGVQQDTLVGIIRRAREDAMKYAKMLGMSPTSRAGLEISIPSEAPKDPAADHFDD